MESIGDQHNIDTPELVAIEMPLAGIGSRFIAALLDSLILFLGMIVLLVLRAVIVPALGTIGTKAASWGVGVYLLSVFLLLWGYFTLFEAFNNGRTVGKVVAKIRVIHQSGRGMNFVESLSRNLV
ncbi:MAG: RDD family protein, partial [Terracidiphilus sp.]